MSVSAGTVGSPCMSTTEENGRLSLCSKLASRPAALKPFSTVEIHL